MYLQSPLINIKHAFIAQKTIEHVKSYIGLNEFEFKTILSAIFCITYCRVENDMFDASQLSEAYRFYANETARHKYPVTISNLVQKGWFEYKGEVDPKFAIKNDVHLKKKRNPRRPIKMYSFNKEKLDYFLNVYRYIMESAAIKYDRIRNIYPAHDPELRKAVFKHTKILRVYRKLS